MVFKRLADMAGAAFGRNMIVTIDRTAMDRLLDTLGRTIPERDGERMGLLGVQKGESGEHIALFQDIPPYSASSHLMSVDHRVMNGFVKHTFEPQNMAVGGMIHTQPNNLSRLSQKDKVGAREFLQGFKAFYKDQTPDYFISPVMHFDRNNNPQITTWVFDSRHPDREPFRAEIDVTTPRGQRMEANNYIRMRREEGSELNRIMGPPEHAC